MTSEAISSDLFMAAKLLKEATGQINTAIHVVAILLLLPELLDQREVVEYLSLGAGNTGREFDLETSHRIAEFKFIQWRGGSRDARRQDNLFQDFFNLAEHVTDKSKYLFLWGTKIPLKFMKGRRSVESVTSRNRSLWSKFSAKYEGRFRCVGDYYAFRRSDVHIVDVEPDLTRLGLVVPNAVPKLAEPE